MAPVLTQLRAHRLEFVPHSTAVDPATFVATRLQAAPQEREYSGALSEEGSRTATNAIRGMICCDPVGFSFWRSRCLEFSDGGAAEYLGIALSASALSMSLGWIHTVRTSRPLYLLPRLALDKLMEGIEVWERLISFRSHPEIHRVVRPPGMQIPRGWSEDFTRTITDFGWTGTAAIDARSLRALEESFAQAELHRAAECFSGLADDDRRVLIPWGDTVLYLAKIIQDFDELPRLLKDRCKRLAARCASQVDPWSMEIAAVNKSLHGLGLPAGPYAPFPKAPRPIILEVGEEPTPFVPKDPLNWSWESSDPPDLAKIPIRIQT